MNTLQPHQQRVVDEKSELDGRLAKLQAFARTDLFLGLDVEERARMIRQEAAMRQYSGVLGERIAAWGAPEPKLLDLDDDTPLAPACDLSGDGTCEACQ